MRFRSVQIRNFKLLRDVNVALSLDPNRPLTVIRAENASGKTSMLNALRWALYGLAGLEDPNVRLSPADWPDKTPCEVSVQIDFEHTVYTQIRGELVAKTDRYRLVRKVIERQEGNRSSREPDRVALYRLTDAGAEPVESAEAEIADILPIEMKDIFFTDGDAAMNFISPQLTRTTKRDQVRDAIKSLLGLGLLEDAERHVKQVQSRFTQRIGATASSEELARVSKNLDEARQRRDQVIQRQSAVTRQIENLGRLYEDADRALQLALQAGRQDELAQRREKARTQLATAKQVEAQLKTEHRALLESESLSWTLLRDTMSQGYEFLNGLHDRGVIPRAAVPFLQDRLELEKCICGASLGRGTPARSELESLIASQRAVDNERQMLTRLLHTARSDFQEYESGGTDWVRQFDSVEANRLNVIKLRQAAEKELEFCEQKLKEIGQADIEEKRAQRDALSSSLREKEEERRDLQVEERDLSRTITDLEELFRTLTEADRKLRTLNARLLIAKDVARIIEGALSELQKVYLRRVSDRMRDLFLGMVGADPEQGSLFQDARITDNYEIVVRTKDGRMLNPDYELNGASQRALTFAFIWALTEVSGVIAPRVIDTPLGMMSGAVKRRVLDIISRASTTEHGGDAAQEPEKQVLLFLTRSEISHTEDILDIRAGRIITFTNTDHYPVDLVNKPDGEVVRIVTCGCDHRHVCAVCQRKGDADYGLALTQAATGGG